MTDRPSLRRVGGLDVHVWPDGAHLERVLDERTTVVCGPVAACACLTELRDTRLRRHTGVIRAHGRDEGVSLSPQFEPEAG